MHLGHQVGVRGPALHGQGALTRSGKHLQRVEHLGHLVEAAQSGHSGAGKDDGVVLPLADLADPGIHVATNSLDIETESESEQLGSAARRPCADAGAGRFDVVKAASEGVTLSFTLPTDLTSGTDNLPIGSWTGGWNTSATPAGATLFTPSPAGTNTAATAGTTISAFVGATVSPAAAQVAGNYTGTVTMSVVYF